MRTSTHPEIAAVKWADRRREPRRPASGKVQMTFEQDPPGAIELDLMDVSLSGFRARHQHGSLPLGADVAFRHAGATGKARVVWNWLHSDYVESGFAVIH